ncbi:MAG: molybdenum cofactor guanylyltransferase [Bacteroidota bacterium]
MIEGRTNLVAGAVLAGGHSSRMGRNKALVAVGGTPMVQAVTHTLSSVFTQVVVVSDQTPAYQFLGLPVIPDIHKEIGPIGGIHSVLATLDVSAVFVLGCDTPFVSEELVRYILRYPARTNVKVAMLEKKVHPLCGIYGRACLPELEACIVRGTRKLRAFLETVETTRVPISRNLSFFRADLLQNINDTAAMEAAQSREP